MSTLRRAIEIALDAHEGQTDKGGAPYILHPLRVMTSVDQPDERIVAVLHDVVEDSEAWSLDRLEKEGFPAPVLEAVEALTKSPREPYFEYIRRVSNVPLAVQVKLADLRDNLKKTRLASNPTEADEHRLRKYRRALRILKGLQKRDGRDSY